MSTTRRSKLYRFLTWEPKGAKKKPWHWKMFHRLWMWAAIILLTLSLPTWLHQPVKFGGDIENPPDTLEQLQTENKWINHYDGTCTDTTTGDIFKC